MKMRTLHIFWSAAVIFTLFLAYSLAAQSSTALGDTILIEKERQFIAPGNISEELGLLMPELKRIEAISNTQSELRVLDSLALDARSYYDTTRAVLLERIDSYSLNSLENKRTEWKSYDLLVISYEKRLRTRMDILTKENDFLSSSSQLWKNTIEKIEESETGIDLKDDINIILDSIQALRSRIGYEIDDLLNIQKIYAGLRQEIQEDLDVIESTLNRLRLSVFERDNTAIWNSIDSTSRWSNFSSGFKESIRENTNVLVLYLEANQTRAFVHALIFILLLGVFIVIQRYRRRYYKGTAILHKQAEIILSYPFISSFALALLASIFIYPDRPLILTGIMVLIMTVPLYMVIPRIFDIKRLNLVLIVIISLAFFDFIQFLLPGTSFFNRVLLLFENLVLAWCFYELHRNRHELIKIAKFWGNIIYKTAIPVIIILVLAFIANITGFLRLSSYIVTALLGISYAGLIITLVVLILNVVTVFFVEFRVDNGMDKQIGMALIRRVFGLTRLGALLLWIRVILVNLGLFNPMMQWYRTLMDTSWTVGTTTISVGGIISFVVIIVITFLLSRWVRKFFMQDYPMLTRLPKGIPAAISMISRYIIVTFGIYIAMSAAGVDLGKFGLIAGALGVGIGFGLQNVVYNFISGLIITIERPIHVGDTVEVGNLMGNVTEIGVRASKVKTFDGSEVIVPNGNIISKEVINWTLSDQKRRLKILVKTEMGADPRKVLEIMSHEASKHPNTLKHPKPMALFDGYGSSSLDFTLYFWVYFDVSFSTKSDVALAIYDALDNEGIGMPVPMQKYFPGGSPPPLAPPEKS